MLLLAFVCVLIGIVGTLLIQIYIFFKQPSVHPTVVTESVSCELPEELLYLVENGSWKEQKESCVAFNLIFQMLFQEWKNTKVIRRWFIHKLGKEFAELQKTTTGKLLQKITIRDLQLGSNVPIVKNIAVNKIQLHKLKKTIEEIDIAFELDYKGGFQLSLDVEMVLRHSAFLSVQMTQLKGLMCLQLTRSPYTHWSCSFFEEPVVNFGVESHFQGRSVPQVTSLIITQIRKMLRKKHTLPNYKMRIKPFFPLPDNITTEFEAPSMDKNFEGNLLEVTVLQCTRLQNIDQAHKLCCTLAVDCSAWIEVTCSQGTSWTTYDFEVVRKKGQQIGILFKQEYLVHRQENCVVVEAVIQNLPAAVVGIKKNDVVLTINGIKVTDSEHAVRVFKHVGERFSIRVQRQSVVQETRFLQEKPPNIVSNTEVVPEDHQSVTTVRGQRIFREENSELSPSKGTSLSVSPCRSQVRSKKMEHNKSVYLKSQDPACKDTVQRKSDGALGSISQVNISDKLLKKSTEFQEQNVEQPEKSEDLQMNSNCTHSVDLRTTSYVPTSQEPLWKENFTFHLTNHLKYLNIGVWACEDDIPLDSSSKNSLKRTSKDKLIGRTSISLVDILTECSSNTQGYHIQQFQLKRPNSNPLPKMLQRYATHSGFEPSLCYGDILLTFEIKPNKEQENNVSSKSSKKVLVGSKESDFKRNSNFGHQEILQKYPNKPLEIMYCDSAPESEDEGLFAESGNDSIISVNHDFIGTHFHSATLCNFCDKKIWLKVAFQCRTCAMICHKKCIAKCQAQSVCSREGARKIALPPTLSPRKISLGHLHNREVPVSMSEPVQKQDDEINIQKHEVANTFGKNVMSSGYEDSGSPRIRRRKIQNLLSSLTQTKTTLPRSGSVHNLVPPTEQHAPLSKSLPPSPQRSPAQSRKCSLQDSSVILWNTYDPEEDDLDRLLEQVLILPHDEGILSLAKERGKTLYSNLSLENRKIKLNIMISKLQTAIDGESERRFQLDKEETRASNTSEKTRLAFLIAKSDEKMQALSVLMLHFLSGLQHCQEQEHQKSPALVSTDVVSEHTIKETKDNLPRQKATNIREQAENIPVVNILSTEEDVVNDTFHPLDNNEYATEVLESSVPQLMLSNDHCNQLPSPVIRGDQNINIQGQFFPDTDALVEQLMIIDEQNIDLQDQHSEESSSLGSHVVTSYDWNINFPEHVSLLTNLSLKQITANKEKYNGDQSQFLPESNSSDLSTVASEDQRSNLVFQNQSQAEYFTVGDDSYHELHGHVSLPHITFATSDQSADGENEKPICEPKLPTASSSSHSSPLI